MTDRGICVTGLGVVSCLGSGVAEFWAALCEGRCGLRRISRFDTEGLVYVHAGVVGPALAPRPEDDRKSLAAHFGSLAAEQALSGFPEGDRAALDLVVATNFGPAELIEPRLRQPLPEDGAPLALPPDLLAADVRLLADELRCGGRTACLSLSCASGNAALTHAAELLRAGRSEAVLVCAYDSIQRMSWAGLAALRVMALPDAEGLPVVRPFDADRSGTVFSEGAACILLESRARAEGRECEVLARLLGAAANNDAYHLTHAAEDGAGAADVIRSALHEAGLEPWQVDHINAHGTGTVLNDVTEARAFGAVFGDRTPAIPVVSNKGGLGHAMGAASLMEAVTAIVTLREQTIPPTANCRRVDPQCPLDVVCGEPRKAKVDICLSNSAGIGGANSAVVLAR